ncbi:hypothetical protein EJ05DRAFT_534005 [Pseudovirgaria hyperparasitica]|uniref:DUF2306 domain-containing protein n=1 Tax=Pseudovirgaria hyperparasitica TaxID=470096 RepID=A0A6A6WJK0_9PEZI|nr:uncharacterized protein EJ05DRAFT_534005 [Pseudovirgaria hyperparasitica]KAF2762454.1 hypothetical protein EJ05DRAFT_534005 [Pseudovirgaria hyperparasitica]
MFGLSDLMAERGFESIHSGHDKLPRDSAVKRGIKKVVGAFGFTKTYNFVLYTITVGALVGFVLARLEYLNVGGVFLAKAIPGEAYHYTHGHRRIGITIHLIGVLFGGLLAALQFTPIIRHKALWLHRISGYAATTLLLLGNAGAFMIMDTSIGGAPAMRVWFGLLGAATTLGLILAVTNIKRLQIDAHRAWMIRVWSWAACIVSLRLLLLAGMHVVRVYGVELVTALRCDEIFSMYTINAGIPDAQNPAGLIYSECGAGAKTSAVQVLVSSLGTGPESSAAALRPLFLMAAWLALAIHGSLAELYLWLTPAESYRLRVVSYQRQVARGWRKAGDGKDAGLTSTRLGDAPAWWSLPAEEQIKILAGERIAA